MTEANTKSQTSPMPRGIEYVRQFGNDPEPDPNNPCPLGFDGIEWSVRDVSVRDYKTGAVVFEQARVKAPNFWSDTAVTFAAQKYFVRTKEVTENHVGEMINGVADTITRAGLEYGYFVDEASAAAFHADLNYLLIHQYAAFNSPVWFNVRRWHRYQIPGGPGNWAMNMQTGKVEQVERAYERPQCSACFIHTIKDSLVEDGGIADFLKAEMRLFKFGSGSGANFSAIREKGAKLGPGGTASGLMSFLPVFDRSAGSVASGGTSRRAAKMVVVNIDHPEIEAFIDWKVNEEKKAQALIAAGFSGGMEGEAYTTVGGQNANNSIRVTDAFMQAVVADKDFHLRSRVDGEVVKTVRARDLWAKIAYAAWFCADPGIQFDDTFNRWHTTPNAGRINATNPCSEYASLDDSACNLASLNLVKFLRPSGELNVAAFELACRTLIIAQDILVSFSSYPTKAIAEGANRYRQLGLGYANLGAALALKGLPYDSEAGRKWAADVTSLMGAAATSASAELAKALGAFAGYSADALNVQDVIEMHAKAAEETQTGELWASVVEDAANYGLRNAQLTLLAPTGTISFLMDCATTGIEPLLAHVQYKKLAGGGDVKIVSKLTKQVLANLGYTGSVAGAIEDHLLQTGSVVDAPGLDPKHYAVFDTALSPFSGGRVIAPTGHMMMMAAVQPFLSGAISKTVNLPTETTPEQVGDFYMSAWDLGIKALAVYRDGCKQSQPVTTKEKTEEKTEKKTAVSASAPAPLRVQRKLPPVRRGLTWEARIDGHKVFIRSGEYEDGSLGEVFVELSKEGSTLGGLVGTWSKTLSLGLQYGVPLEKYIAKFTHTRFEPHGPVSIHPTIKLASSIVDLVMRVLAVHYLGRTALQHVQGEVVQVSPENAPAPTHPTNDAPASTHPANDAPPCRVCGSLTKRTGSCYTCTVCGESGGCG